MAKKDFLGRSIEAGDLISIRSEGMTVTGIVLSAGWWGEKDGWYIELGEAVSDLGYPMGTVYYKQGADGGDIIDIQKGRG